MGLKSEIVRFAKLCYSGKFVAATDGNLSARTGDNHIISTPSSICKGNLETADLVKTDLNGRKISGRKKTSTELKLHLYIYKTRKDVNAVIHTHPIFATAFAAAGLALDKKVLPEIYIMMGEIPLADYAAPSTAEVPQSIAGLVNNHNAILLANHGLVTFGKTIEEAYYLTEKTEQFAEISFYARMLGGEKTLTKSQISVLDELKNKVYNKTGKN